MISILSVSNKRLLLLFCVVLFICSCKKDSIVVEEIVAELDISYSETQALDIFYFSPFNDKKPVLIFVHGGSWYAGDKSEWTIDHINMFLEYGIINISVNYGFTSHPTQINDVAKAVKWVYDNVEKYGGDKNKIFLLGFSAGAHLVSLLSTDESYLKTEGLSLKNINRVCAYDGGNYMSHAESILYSTIENDFRKTFGNDWEGWKKVLPYHQISKGKNIPPFLLVAEKDVDYRIDSNKEFASKLKSNGYEVNELYIPGCNHGEIFYEKFFDRDVKEQIIDFYTKL